MKKEDIENLKKKLTEEINYVPFSELVKHAHFGSLIEVNNLDLIEAAVALATDDIEKVKNWLDNGKIIRCDDQKQKLLGNRPEAVYNFLIIQPYILFKMREIDDEQIKN